MQRCQLIRNGMPGRLGSYILKNGPSSKEHPREIRVQIIITTLGDSGRAVNSSNHLSTRGENRGHRHDMTSTSSVPRLRLSDWSTVFELQGTDI
jgi:hypothetical protein